MLRNTTSLALVALIAIAAASMAALAGNQATGPASRDRASSAGSTPAARRPSVDSVEDVARTYALAARNWTPSTYESSWERQIELAGDGYGRALRAERPDRREFATMRQDHARSSAKVLRIERDGRVRAPNARVLVTLDETTSAAGETIRGITVNEVSLRRAGGRWRVVGWTVIPGA